MIILKDWNLRRAFGSAIEELAWAAESLAERTPEPAQDLAFAASCAVSTIVETAQTLVGA